MIARTQEEIEILREGGKRLGTHVKRLAALVRPGITSKELEDAAAEMVAADGDELAFKDYPSGRQGQLFPGGLCLSVNDVIVHCPAATYDVTIGEGDIVSLDFGIKHRGLFTDHATTVIAGEKYDPEDEKMLSAAFEALQLGIDQARVGNTTGDIGYAVQKIAERYGYGYPLNLSGHGVGAAVHEEPHVPNYGDPGKGDKLVEGLVIAIEPMFIRGKSDLYIDKDGFTYRTKDGSRTCHVEHTVLITKDGPEILTKV
jgi:methionyl aminopeptidase